MGQRGRLVEVWQCSRGGGHGVVDVVVERVVVVVQRGEPDCTEERVTWHGRIREGGVNKDWKRCGGMGVREVEGVRWSKMVCCR